jgi:tetratricopeptide (TPR) repeat protein
LKKILALGTWSLLAVPAPALYVLTQPVPMFAQVIPPSAVKPVTVKGLVTSPTGTVFKSGEGTPYKTASVQFTKDLTEPAEKRKYLYTFPIGADGKYTATGIAPGEYLIVVMADGKSIDYQQVTLKPDEDRTIDFDMTRAEYMKSLTQEQRDAIEANKKKNAGIMAENAKIGDINKALNQARADEKGGKAEDAVSTLKGLVDQHPADSYMSIIWSSLGEAQLAAADSAANAAKAAHTASNTPEIQQKYLDAAASYQKAIDVAPKAQKPTPPEVMGVIQMNLGTALLKGGKIDEALPMFDAAAKTNPAAAGTIYYNEAANLYNMQQNDPAAVAADKAIAADPKRAMAYYIKGQALIPKASVDPKTQKIVAPPGCVEAYQAYLELDPTGVHAKEVTDLLNGIGQPIQNSFKATKKR